MNLGRLVVRHFVAILAGLLVLMSAQMTMACECVELDPVAAYRNDGVVVLAKVTAIETTSGMSPWRVTLERDWNIGWGRQSLGRTC
jgi:hypothetical protein